MTHKADQLAVKALLALGIVACLIWFVRTQFQTNTSPADAGTVPPQATPQSLSSGTGLPPESKEREAAASEQVLQNRIAQLEAEMKTKYAAQEVRTRWASIT